MVSSIERIIHVEIIFFTNKSIIVKRIEYFSIQVQLFTNKSMRTLRSVFYDKVVKVILLLNQGKTNVNDIYESKM